jgi:hypothetical protein
MIPRLRKVFRTHLYRFFAPKSFSKGIISIPRFRKVFRKVKIKIFASEKFFESKNIHSEAPKSFSDPFRQLFRSEKYKWGFLNHNRQMGLNKVRCRQLRCRWLYWQKKQGISVLPFSGITTLFPAAYCNETPNVTVKKTKISTILYIILYRLFNYFLIVRAVNTGPALWSFNGTSFTSILPLLTNR